MDEAYNLKIQAHDFRIKALERDISAQTTSVEGVQKSIAQINNSLMRIQYLLTGAVGFYLLQTIGLTEVIKKLLNL